MIIIIAVGTARNLVSWIHDFRDYGRLEKTYETETEILIFNITNWQLPYIPVKKQ